MSTPRQLPIRFPEADLDFSTLAITDANRIIITAIRRSQHWPYHVFCLVGSAKSGLTTLAKAWAKECGGNYVTGADFEKLSSDDISKLMATDVAIDRPDLIRDTSNLLFGLSAANRQGTKVLLAATASPSRWAHQSKDLESRLKSAPIAELPAPDEDLMRARLRRACARAYLTLSNPVEDYLVTRLGLEYSAIEDTIEALAGLAVDRPITVPLVREVLGQETETPDLFDGD